VRATAPLRRLKKKLQDNLSLSSKLFLRGLYSTATKTAGRLVRFSGQMATRTVNGLAGRLMIDPASGKAKAYSLGGLTLETPDSELNANLLAASKQVSERPAAGIQTSIIIPAFNKAAFTYQCIRSLMQEIDFGENEVIVIDNASTDETQRVLARFGDVLHIIRNEENRGFVDACNEGSAAACGRYLVFLTNDTKVLPGWLDQLVETIEANPPNGAVGSMFLYPDGSIQEAGAFVWSNGEAQHYGWRAAPDDRRFTFAREVDYCSAASLLIKKEIFDRLGGFDRRFEPAYYEDVDLCFGVRSLGYKVIYQPLSRLIHYEGVTAETDTSKGMKRFQITNREKFVAKWHEVLESEHLPKNLKQLTEASNRNRDWPRIVVFDERVPSPDRDAGSLRMFLILKTLAKW
jgi:GT2 family glycosyltransferase